MLQIDSSRAGKFTISEEGIYLYSDRKPCWQASWEAIIELREKLVPKERRPMEIEVQLDGKTIGVLKPEKTEQLEVPLELSAPTAGAKPKSVVEEVVTKLSGQIELPAGRHRVLLIHHNTVDGKLKQVIVSE